MKSTLLFLAIYMLGFSQMTWELDKAHSSVSFTIAHMVVAEVEGSFQKFDGKIVTNSDSFEDSEAELTIETSSIYTNNEKRDGHLKSADFFNAEKNPTIMFKSTEFKKISDSKYLVKGLLTMNGIEKEIELDGKFMGVLETKNGKKAGFKFSGNLNRYDYNLKYGNILEAGGLAIGKEVELEIRAELNLKKK
jgi:polyisoprenoid-binding protein YceI